MSETDPVVREIEIAASPDTVFQFLVDPELMVEWLGQAVEIDPRVGGVVRIDMNGRDVVVGEVLAVDPPRSISFTWGWDREGASLPPGASSVEITLEPRGEGTLLRLRHHRLPKDVREEHRAGWVHYLDRLAIAAAGGDPGPDPLATQDIVHGAPGERPSDIVGKDPDEGEPRAGGSGS